MNLEVLDRARKVSATNAVYVSRKTDLLCFASERREEMYAGSLSGIFKAAYKNGIPIRFFHEDQLASLPSSDIRTLYLPMPLVIDDTETVAFEAFMENGGTLISEACPGFYDESGLLEQSGSVLSRLFNLDHVEVQGAKEWGEVKVLFPNGNYITGRFYRQLVKPGPDTKILATYMDGEPAIIECRRGKGRAVWIGTYPSYHYEQSGDTATCDFLASLLDKTGFKAIQSIKIDAIKPSDIAVAPVVRMLETDDELILVYVNHCDHPVDVSVLLKGEKIPFSIYLESKDGRMVRCPRIHT